MGDFFHSWRRKMGCVTLMLALMWMALWMRSRDRFDQIIVPLGNKAINVASMQVSVDFCLSTSLTQPSRGR